MAGGFKPQWVMDKRADRAYLGDGKEEGRESVGGRDREMQRKEEVGVGGVLSFKGTG